jgi:hypothetical protein
MERAVVLVVVVLGTPLVRQELLAKAMLADQVRKTEHKVLLVVVVARPR